MSDDEFDDDNDIDDEFDGELEEDDALDDDEILDDDLIDDEAAELEIPVVVADVDDDEETPVVPVADEDDDEIVDLEEESHPDDVEEALDVVLRERTAKAGLEDDEEDDDEPDDRGEAGSRIVPRRPGEFVCSSCFLVLPRHMLADEAKQLCSDCV